jgi:2-keto-3-deoxy-L-rhamnonate aldolase RhmA
MAVQESRQGSLNIKRIDNFEHGAKDMTKSENFSARIKKGEHQLGIWTQIPNVVVAENLAQSGADFLLVDGEHAPISPHDLLQILPSTERYDMPVLYRVAWNRMELIKAALDIGVNAIMVPMVNSAAEAREVVAAAKYPPSGKRGMGAWRASNYYQGDAAYRKGANTDTSVVLQIETKEALKNLDEIASTPGVGALYIGPADLALSLGIQLGQLNDDLLAACKAVAAAAKKNGIGAGIDVATLDYLPTYRDLGLSLFTFGSDFSFILEGSRAVTQQFAQAIRK